MEIFEKLPKELQSKVVLYFSTPSAEALRKAGKLGNRTYKLSFRLKILNHITSNYFAFLYYMSGSDKVELKTYLTQNKIYFQTHESKKQLIKRILKADY